MPKIITLELQPADAEPILREAAYQAAYYSALCDHITRRTGQAPFRSGMSFEDTRADWQRRFLKGKRMVEAFGVEYEQTSAEETLTVDHPYKNQKRKIINLGPPLGRVVSVSGGEPDFRKPFPSYRRGGVHEEACRQAADRVVRRWRELISHQ